MTTELPSPNPLIAEPAKTLRADRDFSEDGAKLIDRANRMGGQLGNWVMAGNAGGIVFVLTTRREMESSEPFSLAVAYSGFLWGVVLAFIGHVFIILSSGAAAWALAKIEVAEEAIDRRTAVTIEMAKQGVPRPPEYDALDEADLAVVRGSLTQTVTVPLAFIGLGAYVWAAVLAVLGLASPLFSGML